MKTQLEHLKDLIFKQKELYDKMNRLSKEIDIEIENSKLYILYGEFGKCQHQHDFLDILIKSAIDCIKK